MSGRRTLSRAVVLTALLFAAGRAVAGDVITFLEPKDGALVYGPTPFEFAVRDGAGVERVDLFVGGRLVGSAFPPEWTLTFTSDRPLQAAVLHALAMSDGGIVGSASIRTGRFAAIENVDVDLVQLYPVVTNGRGEYVRDLEAKDFRVTEDGRPIRLRHFSSSPTSLSIAMMIDVSGSMADKLERVQDASIRFAGELDAGDAVSLYAFNHRLRSIVPLTTDRDAVREKIWYLRSYGGTALYDALSEVVGALSEVAGRKAIFLFSDGLDELSMTSLRGAARAAVDGEVIVYAVGTRGEHGESGREDLAALARATGGEAYFIASADELPGIFRLVREHLRAQYALSYAPPPGPAGMRRIGIDVLRPGLRVRYREAYYYSPPGEAR